MSQLNENAVANLDSAQAVELLRVLEQQAYWENLKETAGAKEVPTSQLKDRQKAYEAYRSRLAAYTTKYRTFPLPELTQNSPKWVTQWFRVALAVLRSAGQSAGVETPSNLVVKANRLGAKIAERLKRTPPESPAAPASVAAAGEQVAAWLAWSEAPATPLPTEPTLQPQAA